MATRSNHIPAPPDLLIIGAGIVGLWCALRAVQQGLQVVVVDKGRIGQGASGGLLGALMPHRPVNWNEMKAFQLDALLSLETEISTLEAATGLDCGYRRCGRIMPVGAEKFLIDHQRWQAASQQNWPAALPSGHSLSWQIVDGKSRPDWQDLTAASVACSFDTLSARVDPRRLIQALVKGVERAATFVENNQVASISDNGDVVLADGTLMSAGRVIVSAGYETFKLLEPNLGCRAGWGVKGQAILVRPQNASLANAPIIYGAGTYVVPHDDGLVAIGSTSERNFTDSEADAAVSQKLMQGAVGLCPALEGARIVEEWAGIRPRAAGREPIVGPLPGLPGVIVASGGFKITLGIAHRIADAALACAAGKPDTLPDSFAVRHHLAQLP